VSPINFIASRIARQFADAAILIFLFQFNFAEFSE
jgi:hypothetical protein